MIEMRPRPPTPEYVLVKFERDRQIASEGRSLEHDDQYERGELVAAARCYFDSATASRKPGDGTWPAAPVTWPFPLGWWKPRSRLRDLERAGALCLAEIDRAARTAYQVDITDTSRLLDDILANIAIVRSGADE